MPGVHFEALAQQRIGDQRRIVAGGIEQAPGPIAGIADDQRNPPALFHGFATARPVKLLVRGAICADSWAVGVEPDRAGPLSRCPVVRISKRCSRPRRPSGSLRATSSIKGFRCVTSLTTTVGFDWAIAPPKGLLSMTQARRITGRYRCMCPPRHGARTSVIGAATDHRGKPS